MVSSAVSSSGSSSSRLPLLFRCSCNNFAARTRSSSSSSFFRNAETFVFFVGRAFLRDTSLLDDGTSIPPPLLLLSSCLARPSLLLSVRVSWAVEGGFSDLIFRQRSKTSDRSECVRSEGGRSEGGRVTGEKLESSNVSVEASEVKGECPFEGDSGTEERGITVAGDSRKMYGEWRGERLSTIATCDCECLDTPQNALRKLLREDVNLVVTPKEGRLSKLIPASPRIEGWLETDGDARQWLETKLCSLLHDTE
mmetsp:Transcript_40946/g.66410  ORF Transcript_40946/g.66410 Transcript_40946/m.66410 type:complete len:253 (+) Transcript_40946:2833-3591(+)